MIADINSRYSISTIYNHLAVLHFRLLTGNNFLVHLYKDHSTSSGIFHTLKNIAWHDANIFEHLRKAEYIQISKLSQRGERVSCSHSRVTSLLILERYRENKHGPYKYVWLSLKCTFEWVTNERKIVGLPYPRTWTPVDFVLGCQQLKLEHFGEGQRGCLIPMTLWCFLRWT